MSDPDLRPVAVARRLPGLDATATMPADREPIRRPMPAGPTGPASVDADDLLDLARDLCDELDALLSATGVASVTEQLLPRMGSDDYIDDSLHQLAVEIRGWQVAAAGDREQAAAAVCRRIGDLMRHATGEV